MFQNMVLASPPSFRIVEATSDRIEQNLLALQNHETISEYEAPNVLFRGHVAGNTGYSKANRNIFLALARQGINICLSPLKGLEGSDKQLLERFVTIPNPDSIVIHSCIPTFAETIDARYSILYTTVESATVPQQFIESCHLYNEVWTTSNFCQDVLLNAGLQRPIFVVPNSVDSRHYNERVKPHTFRPPLKRFKFVSVASWNYRKGFDVLLKSYLKAFSSSDDVSLLIVTAYNLDPKGHRRYRVEDTVKEYIEKYGGQNHAHIARCGYSIPENEMPRVYRACNAFVLPTRGEGFGLPYMEASLCGLPVIATNHSGHTMFLKPENSYLVDIDTLSVVGDNQTQVHYWDGQLFPALSDDKVIDEFGRIMRYVFDNKEDATRKNRVLQDEILSSYSCEIAGATAKLRLEEIHRSILQES